MTNGPLERRFTTSFRGTDDSTPGLILKDDGTVWLVNPDESETQLPGGGGAALSAAIIAGSINSTVTGIPQGQINQPYPTDPVSFVYGNINAQTICGPAVLAAAGFFLCSAVAVSAIDTTNAPYTIVADFFAWDAAGANVIHVQGTAQASAGAPGDGANISHGDLSAVNTIGSDLSYNSTNGHIISAAGGTYSGKLAITGIWA